jgi:hypothetical protein
MKISKIKVHKNPLIGRTEQRIRELGEANSRCSQLFCEKCLKIASRGEFLYFSPEFVTNKHH